MYLNFPFALTAPKDHTHSQDCSIMFKMKYIMLIQKYMKYIALQYVFVKKQVKI